MITSNDDKNQIKVKIFGDVDKFYTKHKIQNSVEPYRFTSAWELEDEENLSESERYGRQKYSSSLFGYSSQRFLEMCQRSNEEQNRNLPSDESFFDCSTDHGGINATYINPNYLNGTDSELTIYEDLGVTKTRYKFHKRKNQDSLNSDSSAQKVDTGSIYTESRSNEFDEDDRIGTTSKQVQVSKQLGLCIKCKGLCDFEK